MLRYILDITETWSLEEVGTGSKCCLLIQLFVATLFWLFLKTINIMGFSLNTQALIAAD